jgi:hypothetical protein
LKLKQEPSDTTKTDFECILISVFVLYLTKLNPKAKELYKMAIHLFTRSTTLHARSARRAVPLAFGRRSDVDTSVVEPFQRTLQIKRRNFKHQCYTLYKIHALSCCLAKIKLKLLNILSGMQTYIFIIAGNHVSIGHLVANTVSRFVGVVSPITAFGIGITKIFVHLVSHDCRRRRLDSHGQHR